MISDQASWMIYGAYGYTGALVAEEALRRGHRPLLAGRSKEKLLRLAERLGLNWVVVDLDDKPALTQAVSRVELVFHAAGPFVHTGDPMMCACLEAGTHYVDVSGEIPVFRNSFSHDQAALRAGVALLSGAGFEVIPGDCMAEYVAKQLPQATELELGVEALNAASPGTIKTMLELFSTGGLVRRDGQLVPHPWGKGVRSIPFPDGERAAAPIPSAELAAAFQTTGIPNITTYMAFPRWLLHLMRWTGPLAGLLLKIKPLRRLLERWVDRSVRGPDAETRRRGRSFFWARVTTGDGREVQAWLETLETYRFTATAGVHCVERIFKERPIGALTPALAFGADFVLEWEGTRRYDTLPPA